MNRRTDNSHDGDRDLRARFAEQRRGDHAAAPAWRGEWLHAAAAPSRIMLRWRWPVALGMACAVAAAAVVWMPSSFKAEPRLTEALPPLFDEEHGERLFAGLEPSFPALESPSDFLLPDSLQSHLNLLNLP